MRIAYIISAYKLPEQLVRLVERLNDDGATFFVHVDKKTDRETYGRMVRGTCHMPNVHFLNRYKVYWGGFGHVQATLEGIYEIIKRKTPADYVILMTGQDYPIKTNHQIRDFLQKNSGKSFLHYFSMPSDQWEGGGLQRMEKWHIRKFNRYYVFPRNGDFFIRRRLPLNLQPFGGSSYWCLSEDCLAYVHKFISDNPGYVNFFKFVDVPDEIFFQTILLNSPIRDRIINDDLRYIAWKIPDSGSPEILVKEDFENIKISPKLFARKFDVTVDADVLDLIDQQLLGEG